MKNIWTIIKKELFTYFLSPIAYVALFVFLLYNGIVFYIILQILNQPMSITGAPMALFFGQIIFFYLLIIVLCSILTMRSLAEERRSGTFETLMTSPVTDLQVVVGKFLSAWLFYIILWVPTLLYPIILERYSDPDWGPIASGYLGTILLGGLFIAIGVFTSSLTKNQLIASILSFLILGIFFVLGLMEYISGESLLKSVFSYINIWAHMEDFSKGIVDTKRLVYYSTMIILFIFAAMKSFQLKRIRS
ncbi:MAG: ABC transporter permease [Pseudomonadota bacterium]